MRHFASDYLGKKWVLGARGPDTFDCWGLLYDIYKNQYHIDVPLYPVSDGPVKESILVTISDALKTEFWQKIEAPVEGCAVMMGTNLEVSHVGIYLDVDGGVVLHSRFKSGVVCQRLNTLRNQNLNVLGFYLPLTWPTSS